MTPDEELQDAILHHTLNLFRLSAAQVTATMKRLKEMEKRLLAELSSATLADAKKSEIKAILSSAEEIIVGYYKTIQLELPLDDLSRTIANVTGKSLNIALGVEGATMPTQAYFATLASNVLILGSPAKDWWAKQGDDLAFRFSSQVRQGLANAETNQQIIQRIVGTRTSPGIMTVARRNAASLVQTEVQAVANDARLETFRANSDVVQGLQQVSTLDSHTTEICIAYSGAEWDLDGNPVDGSPAFNGGCPRHFNCRSIIVPITKSLQELGVDVQEPEPTTRASDEGQVSAKTSFNDFLERKGEDYQNEVLGEGRADLWRDGKITLRDLVDGRGRPLTLAELKQKFAS